MTSVSHRESKTVGSPRDHATTVCAAKERPPMFRNPVLEWFGNRPEYGHNWARDMGNTNLDRGTFWKCSSESFLNFKAFMVKKPKYQLWNLPSDSGTLGQARAVPNLIPIHRASLSIACLGAFAAKTPKAGIARSVQHASFPPLDKILKTSDLQCEASPSHPLQEAMCGPPRWSWPASPYPLWLLTQYQDRDSAWSLVTTYKS